MKKPLLFLIFLCVTSVANAQYITTVAGTGIAGYTGIGGPATAAEVSNPVHVCEDTAGNIYFLQTEGYVSRAHIYKIDSAGILTICAGNGSNTFSGDGGPATTAGFFAGVITADKLGNIYINDSTVRIRKINAAGIITTIAGTGIAGDTGDGGPATAAEMTVGGMTTDTAGNIYMTDPGDHVVRKIDASGIITRFAGTGTAGFSGDGGPATDARLYEPLFLTTDLRGNVYVADNTNNDIRKIDASGIITTVAGTGTPGFSGDGGPATAAQINYGTGIFADAEGNLLIADGLNYRVRSIDTFGIIRTIAGGGAGPLGDGGPATAATMTRPELVWRRGNGNIYVADGFGNRIRMILTKPFFINGPLQHITFCHGTTLNLDTLLAANDSNTGNTEAWGLIYGPLHGMATVGYTTVSTGNVLYPAGQSYTPAPGYTGPDTMMVRVSDGVITDTTTLVLNVQGAPVAGIITGPDTVCIPNAIILADTAAAGVWSGSNASAAITDSLCTGLSPGPDTISYTVANTCGAAVAYYVVTVKGCNASVGTVKPFSGISVSPNPNDGSFSVTVASAINSPVKISITNLQGEQIKTLTLPANRPTDIQLNAPPGIYFITAIMADGLWRGKVVIR